jgi:hypothetical protein
MLLVFYLNVTKIDLDVTYTCMLQAYVLSVIRYFIWTLHMVQLLYLDVSKVDRSVAHEMRVGGDWRRA